MVRNCWFVFWLVLLFFSFFFFDLLKTGNGEDLGAVEPLMNKFARYIQNVSFYAYDYPGQGMFFFIIFIFVFIFHFYFLFLYLGYSFTRDIVVPSQQGCFEAIEAAFEYVQQEGFKPEQIVIFGRSLGKTFFIFIFLLIFQNKNR
jgi:hypothetical protein